MRIEKTITFLVLLILLAVLEACSGSKAYFKKGEQLQEAGLQEEAAKYYYMALQRNSNNVDAQIHLKKAAQTVLDDKLAEFYKSHGVENYKAAVYTYSEAMDFKSKMERFVNLDVAPYYESYYEESKNAYLESRYNEALGLFEDGKFEQADGILKEITTLDPHYEDVKNLKKVTEAEPLYQEAIGSLEAQRYKEAYKKFDEVISLKGDYKKAIEYRDKARERSELTIALLPVESTSKTMEQEIVDKYYGKILSELLAQQNPFIRVIDRVNTDKIIAEQKLALSGLIDESEAAKTGELLGAKIVVTGKIVDLEMTDGEVKKETKKGYQAVRKKKFNPIGNYFYYATEYEKVQYAEYHGNSVVSTSFEFQMISSETGEVLLSEIFNLKRRDEVDYAVYEGDHRSLYPGTWESKNGQSSKDQVYTSVAQKQHLDRMLASRHRTLKSTVELKADLIEEIAAKIARKIVEYERNR